jgi:two-component system CheB/CheR fusion protein
VSQPAPPTTLAANAIADAWVGQMLSCSNEYAVIGLSLDGRIVGWHGAAQRLFGYTAAEIAGSPFASLFTPPDIERRIPELELELARQAGRSEDDRWHVRSDGSQFWASGVVNKHHNPQQELLGFVKVLRDRTDPRTRYEALQNRLEIASRELARQRETLATLVHELRNPVAPILNAARVLDSDASAETKSGMLAVIARQTEVLQRLLQDASGQLVTVREERLVLRSIVLQHALKAAVDALMPQARAKNLSLALVCPAAPIVIEVDPVRLQQMVMNLLSNALKYTRAAGHVTVGATVEAEMVVIKVDDDGEGIARENLERVFELFTREETSDAVEGAGVGLAVVKRLAWLHGGFVEVRSPGKGLGSQFTLQLPLKHTQG